ncbi:hypothetical protein A2Z10_01245 [Candidatus Azambacteria bacterium RBG_16_47_10]|uniref:Ribosomal RNA small subunit methyltransferase E n=1 Tax=Candidatus Azambacteria bacterium RBG_16_47_10 TaxID=1797292 RepID=A0A1F5B0R9_9BACT|nr:MAG: hypothetical protein A2Z10_01245 [Candidatus Azambacteria bacterium RBG_16_47_10]
MIMHTVRYPTYNIIMRFFITEPISTEKDLVIADAGIGRQVTKVLRKKAGDEIIVLDGSGNECVVMIKENKKDVLVCEVLTCTKNSNEPAIPLVLYQSVLKKDKMEWVFEKGTEIGVSEFVPFLSEHSVKLGINPARAHKIAQEAAEQSRRGKIPTIADTMLFDAALAHAQASGYVTIIAHNIGAFANIRKCGEMTAKAKGINVFIGPEGGFSEDEIARASQSGFRVVSLGKRVLRAETAAIVACFSVIS